MSTERERHVDELIRAGGFAPSLVGIGRDDDVVWAAFHGLHCYEGIVGRGDSDEEAAADIVLQAHERGIECRKGSAQS